jgi:hypothetical protein
MSAPKSQGMDVGRAERSVSQSSGSQSKGAIDVDAANLAGG